MNKLLPLALILLLAPVIAPAAEESEAGEATVITTQTGNVFKGLLYKVWSKLRAVSPRPERERRVAVTAGIRGAETTTSLIQPYWKDDRTSDPGYVEELKRYTSAQQLAEQGDLQGAVTALKSFIDEHAGSELRANAQFALGISYGALGDKQAGVQALQSFVEDNPKHPLVADARQVIDELK